MKFTFNANNDGGMCCTLEDGNHISITTTENGDVTIVYTPHYTSGYLRTDLDSETTSLSDEPEYHCSSASTTWSEDDEDMFMVDLVDDVEYTDDEDETTEDDGVYNEYDSKSEETEDPSYRIAMKIAEFDKDGAITSLLTSLLKNSKEKYSKAAETIGKIMVNLVDEMEQYKGKL